MRAEKPQDRGRRIVGCGEGEEEEREVMALQDSRYADLLRLRCADAADDLYGLASLFHRVSASRTPQAVSLAGCQKLCLIASDSARPGNLVGKAA